MNADEIGRVVWDPGAGYADPVGTVNGLLALARRRGAELEVGTRDQFLLGSCTPLRRWTRTLRSRECTTWSAKLWPQRCVTECR